jgi:putative membrane protein
MDRQGEQDPRVYFAAERTFLAWTRTGLALMGVGFAVARFGLFLRELRGNGVGPPIQATGASVSTGVAIVALGVIVTLSATFDHIRIVRQLRAGTFQPGAISKTAVTLAVLLAVIGICMGGYLVYLR